MSQAFKFGIPALVVLAVHVSIWVVNCDITYDAPWVMLVTLGVFKIGNPVVLILGVIWLMRRGRRLVAAGLLVGLIAAWAIDLLFVCPLSGFLNAD